MIFVKKFEYYDEFNFTSFTGVNHLKSFSIVKAAPIYIIMSNYGIARQIGVHFSFRKRCDFSHKNAINLELQLSIGPRYCHACVRALSQMCVRPSVQSEREA